MSRAPLRSPLGRAIGLGSAKEGVEHWWMQRLTAVALVPLTIWFVAALIGHLGLGYGDARLWLHAPGVAIPMALLVVAAFVHMALGIQVVIEDYVHREGTKFVSLVLVRLACWAVGAAALFAVLRVGFGG